MKSLKEHHQAYSASAWELSQLVLQIEEILSEKAWHIFLTNVFYIEQENFNGNFHLRRKIFQKL